MKAKAQVFGIISKIMRVPLAEVSEDSSPDTLEAWDSLTHMNLVMALEEAFEIQFEVEDIADMLNVELILMAIEKAKTAQR